MAYASYGNNSQQTPKEAQRPDSQAAAAKPEARPDMSGSGPGEAGERGGEAAQGLPAAGPHADPALTNDKATPGAGTLPEAGDRDATDATSG
jgi:hypothetical protein